MVAADDGGYRSQPSTPGFSSARFSYLERTDTFHRLAVKHLRVLAIHLTFDQAAALIERQCLGLAILA